VEDWCTSVFFYDSAHFPFGFLLWKFPNSGGCLGTVCFPYSIGTCGSSVGFGFRKLRQPAGLPHLSNFLNFDKRYSCLRTYTVIKLLLESQVLVAIFVKLWRLNFHWLFIHWLLIHESSLSVSLLERSSNFTLISAQRMETRLTYHLVYFSYAVFDDAVQVLFLRFRRSCRYLYWCGSCLFYILSGWLLPMHIL